MTTKVFFATNRVVTGPADVLGSYSNGIVTPTDPAALTYGVAQVDGIDVDTNAQGTVTSLGDTNQGDFAAPVRSDLSTAGQNLLVFVHGFDNTFSDALTRGAFNREWMAASGIPSAAATVIAFSWPSLGRLVSTPVLQEDYLKDQAMAGQSGFHLMTFFSRLQPILDTVRQRGQRTTLLAHSMGNHALEAAVESWFVHGNGEGLLFDDVVLAAADCRYDTFEHAQGVQMSGLDRLTGRTSTYFSNVDQVLHLSQFVNLGAQRLGQDGPRDKADPAQYPGARYRMVDCTLVRDYDVDFLNSHQYYRQSPSVRADIAAAMGGLAPPPAPAIV
ncbi:MAG: alpha/beta hydrolase [Acetobacteraceae bacterium]|nr:alpha/beta hydrolase [Acetobacteraceae bacterium]